MNPNPINLSLLRQIRSLHIDGSRKRRYRYFGMGSYYAAHRSKRFTRHFGA